MKWICILILCSACATVTPQTIEVGGRSAAIGCLTVRLHESQASVQEALKKSDSKKSGYEFYNYIQNVVECEKWDFEGCGHGLFHALRIWGSPRLILDPGYEDFDNH